MKFYDRSKILFRILSLIAVLLAVILVIKSFSLDTLNIDFDTLFFFGGCVLLLDAYNCAYNAAMCYP